MQSTDSLRAKTEFIAEYATRLMGSGVHTSRVVRNSKRIGDALNIEVRISAFQKVVILTAVDRTTRETLTEVADVPSCPISFELNAELSALSWDACDLHLPLGELRRRYAAAVAAPAMDGLFVLILAGFANASFCRLFGGDMTAMCIVFSATLIGLFIKQRMQAAAINHYITFIVASFAASMYASVGLVFDSPSSEVAIATSVLFLIPGVPLINGVIDIVEGHVLNGAARLVAAVLLIVCIAIGLSATLMIVKNNLL
ncbi:MAG: threonine/serine exporter family protein [Alistipes sp.]|nr:threonine/serine exporter family protein [Alistipes sp.]MDE6857868.1 threonine/serine exporter family protein [Alistipes sp.]